jgi:DNA (cytosine-5)-methyltransferase 1
MAIVGAVGVHQGQDGGVSVADTAYTLSTYSGASARNAPLIAHTKDGAGAVHPDVAGTLCASGAGLSRPGGMASEPDLCVAYALQGNMIGRQDHNGPMGSGVSEEVAFTITAADTPGVATIFNRYHNHFQEDTVVGTQTARQSKDETALICRVCEPDISAVDCRNYKEIGDMSGTLQAKNKPGYSLNFQNPVRTGYIVRRLTPTECERLQGYPDGWTAFGHDGREISDTRRYQMLGNSVAIPCVMFVLGGIAEQNYEKGGDV